MNLLLSLFSGDSEAQKMADSLGEKLRQARLERDISISEVAEQTRISALYLEAIEKDDYSSLPGGIFNKGFVKSFAKYVGVDENEALKDYADLMARQESAAPDSKSSSYNPQVLTDDSRSGSMLPTIIFAVLILGLMAWGIHALVKYVQSTQSSVSGDDSLEVANVKTDEPDQQNSNSTTKTPASLPSMDSISVKISTTTGEPLDITSTTDGKTETLKLTAEIKERVIEAQQSVKLRYYKGLANIVSIEVNGRKIESPVAPPGYKLNGLEYEINKENIRKILTDGKVFIDGSVTEETNADVNSNANVNVPDNATQPENQNANVNANGSNAN